MWHNYRGAHPNCEAIARHIKEIFTNEYKGMKYHYNLATLEIFHLVY